MLPAPFLSSLFRSAGAEKPLEKGRLVHGLNFPVRHAAQARIREPFGLAPAIGRTATVYRTGHVFAPTDCILVKGEIRECLAGFPAAGWNGAGIVAERQRCARPDQGEEKEGGKRHQIHSDTERRRPRRIGR